ncbi:MAG: hypothetical protein JO154_01695 [Chitinophaga sp.]|uniref:hypothetical protein n=1 Tax=Chitinophaga sp. TaxID=1869181 RepID=UPI0025B9248E|nr:hypothetical protein [Chitinophaga sp.]MBV8251292.1 hypothetical protein [Chitinophaga sp.]
MKHTLRYFFSGIVGCLLCIASTVDVMAQTTGKAPVSDITVSILEWVKHLDKGLDKYATAEKKEDLNDKFGNLSRELTEYMQFRKRLSDSLFRHNIAPGKKDEVTLEIMKEKMSGIMQRMRDVTDLTNNDLRSEGDRLNEKMYNMLYGDQVVYLSNLEAFLAGYDVTKKDLAVDGSANTGRLQESVNILNTMQSRLRRK